MHVDKFRSWPVPMSRSTFGATVARIATRFRPTGAATRARTVALKPAVCGETWVAWNFVGDRFANLPTWHCGILVIYRAAVLLWRTLALEPWNHRMLAGWVLEPSSED